MYKHIIFVINCFHTSFLFEKNSDASILLATHAEYYNLAVPVLPTLGQLLNYQAMFLS